MSRVEEDSPAMNAGLQTGDIISSANGTEVFTRTGFTRILLSAQPGDMMPMHIFRPSGEGYSEMDLTAELQ